jgi:uncharacterized membrane protein YuzA (DUF378 family)
MKTVDIIAAVLLVVGVLNWGLVGVFGADAVAGVFGSGSGLGRAACSLVGAGALYQALRWKANQRRWAYAGAEVRVRIRDRNEEWVS